MRDIKILKITDCESSKFLQPKSIFYTQNGVEKRWDYIKSHDSASCILYHTQKDAFLLVKQFRPAVFINNEGSDGFTYEMCAGILDKNLTPIETIKEEIFEECGYEVEVKNIKKVTSYISSVGITGSHQNIFFTKIDESMKKSEGGGTDDECIELFFLPKSKIFDFINDESKSKTPGVLFSLLWYLKNEANL
ncbi:MAG: NUDIX domain-containing protein [Campylobacteraceae bacterium]